MVARAFCGLLLAGCAARTLAQAPAVTPGLAHETVEGIARLIEAEYMDAATGARLAGVLRRRLADGGYADATTADALATRVSRDLFAGSHDRHLAVQARTPATAGFGAAGPGRAEAGRAEAARRSNGGVQRVEILAGNVGYLNLTAFWRIDEARDAIADAMRLLRRADALIIDMRENGGGSPDTVVLLMGYLFDQGGLLLFDIVPRTGDRATYATANPPPAEHDGQRPMWVLTSSRTFSGGEGFAFLLQERHRAEVVGEPTPGAANPGQSYVVNDAFQVMIPNGQVRSAVSGGNWENRGVTPDIKVAAADALAEAHARAQQRLSRAAAF